MSQPYPPAKCYAPSAKRANQHNQELTPAEPEKPKVPTGSDSCASPCSEYPSAIGSVVLIKQTPNGNEIVHTMTGRTDVDDEDKMKGIAVDEAMKNNPGFGVVSVLVRIIFPNAEVSDGGPLTHESKQDANPPFAAPLG